MDIKTPFGNEKVITKGIDQRLPKELVFILWQLLCGHVRDDIFDHRPVDYFQIFELSSGEAPGALTVKHWQEQPHYCRISTVYLSDTQNIRELYGVKVYVIDDGTHSTMLFPEEY